MSTARTSAAQDFSRLIGNLTCVNSSTTPFETDRYLAADSRITSCEKFHEYRNQNGPDAIFWPAPDDVKCPTREYRYHLEQVAQVISKFALCCTNEEFDAYDVVPSVEDLLSKCTYLSFSLLGIVVCKITKEHLLARLYLEYPRDRLESFVAARYIPLPFMRSGLPVGSLQYTPLEFSVFLEIPRRVLDNLWSTSD